MVYLCITSKVKELVGASTCGEGGVSVSAGDGGYRGVLRYLSSVLFLKFSLIAITCAIVEN